MHLTKLNTENYEVLKMRTTRALIAGAIALAITMSSMGLLQPVFAETPALSEIELETGSTQRFGGGDYVALNLGDARFAVLYGNQTNPNCILIASEFTRYLGGADVYRQSGQLIESGPIPVRTMLAQKFMYFVEFTDTDQDKMLGNATQGDYTNFTGPEPVKALSLNRSWQLSQITTGTDENGNKTWEFSLTVENLQYSRVWTIDQQTGQQQHHQGNETEGVVEKISFMFRISAGEEYVEREIPWFEITVRRQNGSIEVDTQRIENKTVNGTVVTADVKYDHDIEGWDFADDNNMLALETHTLFANHRHRIRAREWLGEGFENQIGSGGEAGYYFGGGQGNQSATFDGNGTMQNTLIARNEINFDDNWERVGRFRWVSDVEITKDGQTTTEQMRFQVHDGERIMREGFDGQVFNGFVVKGAFLYPSGEEIFHDPALTTEVMFLDAGMKSLLLQPVGIALQATAAFVAIGMVIGYKLYARKK